MGTLRVTMCSRMFHVKMLELLIQSGRIWPGNSVSVTVMIVLHMVIMMHHQVASVVVDSLNNSTSNRITEPRLSVSMMVDEDTIYLLTLVRSTPQLLGHLKEILTHMRRDTETSSLQIQVGISMPQVVAELLLAKIEAVVRLLCLRVTTMLLLQDVQQPPQLNRITQLACTESPDKLRTNQPKLADLLL